MADFRRSFLRFPLLPALLLLCAVYRLQSVLCLDAVAWQTLLPEPETPRRRLSSEIDPNEEHSVPTAMPSRHPVGTAGYRA